MWRDFRLCRFSWKAFFARRPTLPYLFIKRKYLKTQEWKKKITFCKKKKRKKEEWNEEEDEEEEEEEKDEKNADEKRRKCQETKKKKKNNYANKQEKKRKKYVNMHTVIRTPRSSPNKTPVSSKVSSLKSIDVVNSPK